MVIKLLALLFLLFNLFSNNIKKLNKLHLYTVQLIYQTSFEFLGHSGLSFHQ